MRLIPDKTGRFAERPYFEDGEMDAECDRAIYCFLQQKYGSARFPISTEDIKSFIETKADLDVYAALAEGEEGKTDFRKRKPDVHIAELLSSDPRHENRLRTTLTHEWGHVHFHGPFYEMKKAQLTLDIFHKEPELVLVTYRANVLGASETDWLEWQAGYASGALLMPISDLRPRVLRFFSLRETVSAVTAAHPVGQELIRKVALKYQVSHEAARVRLEQLRYLSSSSALSEQGNIL